MNMDIPPQTLNDVYKTIAQRHETEPAKLTREKIISSEGTSPGNVHFMLAAVVSQFLARRS